MGSPEETIAYAIIYNLHFFGYPVSKYGSPEDTVIKTSEYLFYPSEIVDNKIIVLGVGAFEYVMQNLRLFSPK